MNSLKRNKGLGGVRVHFPAQIAGGHLVYHGVYARKVGSHVVFKSVLADKVQQFLQPRNLHHACAAKSLERVVGKSAATRIAPDFPVDVYKRQGLYRLTRRML